MTPNFSGIWTLNREASDFAFLPPPKSRVDTITQDGPRLHIRTRQHDANGDATVDRNLIPGDDFVTVLIHGRERRVRAFFDGGVLVLETRSEVSGNARRIEDRLSLDPERAWLTIERLFEQPGGPVRQRLKLQRAI